MRQDLSTLVISTKGRGLSDFTHLVRQRLEFSGVGAGLVTLFCMHTSASLLIQENADPDVLADLETFFERLVSEEPSIYRHTAEGRDDMPAHIRTALTQTQLSIPVADSQLLLGSWQGIYLFEHRRSAHSRNVALHIIGE